MLRDKPVRAGRGLLSYRGKEAHLLDGFNLTFHRVRFELEERFGVAVLPVAGDGALCTNLDTEGQGAELVPLQHHELNEGSTNARVLITFRSVSCQRPLVAHEVNGEESVKVILGGTCVLNTLRLLNQ